MNMRVRRLWAPVLVTFLMSVVVQSAALRVPQWPPWVFFTRNGVSIVLAPLWLLALPFIGALGAWLSLQAGGSTRDRVLAALAPAWLNGAIMTLGVPLSMVVERHFSLSVKLTVYTVYMTASCLVPAVLLALGALPWLGHKATMRGIQRVGEDLKRQHKRNAMDRVATVREILRRWDPIGVQPGECAPADEYDSYAPHLVSMVAQGCSRDELREHLGTVRTDTIGVGENREKDWETAGEILEAIRGMNPGDRSL